LEFILVTSLWSGFDDIKCGFVDEMYVDGSVVCIMQKLVGCWILGGGWLCVKVYLQWVESGNTHMAVTSVKMHRKCLSLAVKFAVFRHL
jgi:hypothetical protein